MPQPLLILIAFLTALFAQLMHMNKLNRKFISNDQVFRRDKYWNAEQFSILATIVWGIIFCLAFPYAAKEYHFSDFTQILLYALAGGIGVAGFSYFLSGTEKYLKKQINDRLNSDNQTEDKTE